MKKLLIVNCLLFVSFLFTSEFYSQVPDSTEEKPVQYRRGIELKEGYQSYDEKYAGKNLNEEKRRLFLLEGTGIWTELNPRVPRVDYLGIGFINKDTGWAVGDLGALIKTTDGGNSWTVSETNTTTPLLKVRSYNGQIVIASGFGGLILRSTDCGETFEQMTSGVTGDLWGLQMINDTLGWACGNQNSLTKTTDGGQTWQRVFTPGYTSDYWWIDFINENYGFLAANGKILRTIDGGVNWEIIQAGDDFPLFSIDVIDSLHIAAAGYGGTSYRGKNIYSSDGGFTWINGGPLTFEPANCIKYLNIDTGYVILNEVGIWKTTNKGENWTGIGSLGEWEIQFFVDDIIGYNAGSALRINKADGNLDAWNKLIINDNFIDIYFTSEITGYAAANRVIYKTESSGENWFVIPSFPSHVFTSALGSITFTDSLTGFAGGPPCRIVKTTDAGNSWYGTNRTGLTDTTGSVRRIFFINATTGWAVTSRGGILKTTDAGENWFTQLNAGISVIFYSVYFVDSLYGWTANSNARPYKTTDGGNNWVHQSNINIGFSRDIYLNNFLNGFIVESNILYKSVNGGITWNVIPGVSGFSIAARFSYYDDIIFVTGATTYRSINSGEDWAEFIELNGVRISGLSLLGAGHGYAVGELGLVLKYLDKDVPVELISFNSELIGNIVTLKWITSTETNNQGFYIQRKKGNEVEWTNLTFISGAGTSTSINYYYYNDELSQLGKYKYRLKQTDFNGQYEYSNEIEVEYFNRFDFYLSQNYPNPFNPTTKIDFNLPEKTFVRIILYDVTGKEIKKIVNEEKEAGNYSVSLNSEGISSGIYFYKMITSSGFTAVNKLTIMK